VLSIPLGAFVYVSGQGFGDEPPPAATAEFRIAAGRWLFFGGAALGSAAAVIRRIARKFG